jgi:hypothetical protein
MSNPKPKSNTGAANRQTAAALKPAVSTTINSGQLIHQLDRLKGSLSLNQAEELALLLSDVVNNLRLTSTWVVTAQDVKIDGGEGLRETRKVKKILKDLREEAILSLLNTEKSTQYRSLSLARKDWKIPGGLFQESNWEEKDGKISVKSSFQFSFDSAVKKT